MGLTQVSTDGVKNDAITKTKIPANQIEASELADNAVDTNAIANDAVTTAKIADDAVNGSHLADAAINNTSIIADNVVSTNKLTIGTSSNDGKFLRANNGSAPTFETVNTDLVADTSPQLGGDLDTNSHEILLDASHSVKFATNQGQIYHSGSQMYIGTNELRITNYAVNETMAKFVADGAVELFHNDSKKLETTSSGISVTGDSYSTTGVFGISSSNNIDFTADNRMSIHINGAEDFRFESDGDFHADGDVYAFSTTVSSDENLKKDIVTVGDAVTKVEALKGVTFKWKKNDADSAGVIAQDVEKVLPQVVKTVNDMDGNEYKAVNYAGLTSILIEAVKDLSARVKVLEAK